MNVLWLGIETKKLSTDTNPQTHERETMDKIGPKVKLTVRPGLKKASMPKCNKKGGEQTFVEPGKSFAIVRTQRMHVPLHVCAWVCVVWHLGQIELPRRGQGLASIHASSTFCLTLCRNSQSSLA